MHPYEVAQTLRSRAKHESVRLNYGSLYGVVDSLEGRGLIRAVSSERQGKRPERTTYEITDDGSRELVDWLTDLVAAPVKEYPQFETALSFLPVLAPDDVLALLRTRVDALELEVSRMRGGMQHAAEMGLPRIFSLEAEYEVALRSAELDFIRPLINELETGTLEGLDMWVAFHSDTPA